MPGGRECGGDRGRGPGDGGPGDGGGDPGPGQPLDTSDRTKKNVLAGRSAIRRMR